MARGEREREREREEEGVGDFEIQPNLEPKSLPKILKTSQIRNGISNFDYKLFERYIM